MNTAILRPGHRVKMTDGRQVEVLESAREDAAIRVAYLDEAGGPFGSPLRTAEEALVSAADLEALLGVVPPVAWRQEITVVLHHAPETEEGPAEYRAETLSGVPNDVIVSGGSETSSQQALNHLLGGLSLMGFSGYPYGGR